MGPPLEQAPWLAAQRSSCMALAINRWSLAVRRLQMTGCSESRGASCTNCGWPLRLVVKATETAAGSVSSCRATFTPSRYPVSPRPQRLLRESPCTPGRAEFCHSSCGNVSSPQSPPCGSDGRASGVRPREAPGSAERFGGAPTALIVEAHDCTAHRSGRGRCHLEPLQAVGDGVEVALVARRSRCNTSAPRHSASLGACARR